MQIENEERLLKLAIAGEKEALEALLLGVQDMVFHLSLRMLGLVPDAEDATQEILIKVMTRLSSFEGRSSFSTWVYRIAANHLKDCRKGMFVQHPLSFEFYGEDIASGREADMPDLTGGVDAALLERELKLSCTNVMLQCLEPEDRSVFVLGTMFRLDSRLAAEVLDLTPEAYRQRLSRVRRRMSDFLSEYCGLSGSGLCACKRRISYAVATHRLDPQRPVFTALETDEMTAFTDAMEELDIAAQVFGALPAYHAPKQVAAFVRSLLVSRPFAAVTAK